MQKQHLEEYKLLKLWFWHMTNLRRFVGMAFFDILMAQSHFGAKSLPC
jgi:hypothetical protein